MAKFKVGDKVRVREDVAILSADWQDFDYFELYEIRGKWYIND